MDPTKEGREAAKTKLGYHFQELVNAIGDANLPPEGLEVVELLVAAKKRCWEVIDGKPKGANWGGAGPVLKAREK